MWNRLINAKEFYTLYVQKIDIKFLTMQICIFQVGFGRNLEFLPNYYISYIFKNPHAFYLKNLSQSPLYTVRFIKKIEINYFHGMLFGMRSDRCRT